MAELFSWDQGLPVRPGVTAAGGSSKQFCQEKACFPGRTGFLWDRGLEVLVVFVDLGFPSLHAGGEGYLLIYREDNPAKKARIRTWLPEGRRVRLVPVVSRGAKKTRKVKAGGFIDISLKDTNSYIIFKYTIK